MREGRVLPDSAVRIVLTRAIPDDTALLIWAAEEEWQVGNPDDLSLATQDQELSPDDEDAYVLLRFEFGWPKPAGPVQVLRLSAQQVISDVSI